MAKQIRIQSAALMALQSSAEDLLTDWFSDSSVSFTYNSILMKHLMIKPTKGGWGEHFVPNMNYQRLFNKNWGQKNMDCFVKFL